MLRFLLMAQFTALKVSVFAVIPVRIFPYSVRIRENTVQNNPEYGRFSCSDLFGSINSNVVHLVKNYKAKKKSNQKAIKHCNSEIKKIEKTLGFVF